MLALKLKAAAYPYKHIIFLFLNGIFAVWTNDMIFNC